MLEQIPVARILFIDDDVDLVTLLSDYLSLDNMLVRPPTAGPKASASSKPAPSTW